MAYLELYIFSKLKEKQGVGITIFGKIWDVKGYFILVRNDICKKPTFFLSVIGLRWKRRLIRNRKYRQHLKISFNRRLLNCSKKVRRKLLTRVRRFCFYTGCCFIADNHRYIFLVSNNYLCFLAKMLIRLIAKQRD